MLENGRRLVQRNVSQMINFFTRISVFKGMYKCINDSGTRRHISPNRKKMKRVIHLKWILFGAGRRCHCFDHRQNLCTPVYQIIRCAFCSCDRWNGTHLTPFSYCRTLNDKYYEASTFQMAKYFTNQHISLSSIQTAKSRLMQMCFVICGHYGLEYWKLNFYWLFKRDSKPTSGIIDKVFSSYIWQVFKIGCPSSW